MRNADPTILVRKKYLPIRCLDEFNKFFFWIIKRMRDIVKTEAYPLKAP